MLRTFCVLVLMLGLYAKASQVEAGVKEELSVVETAEVDPGAEALALPIETVEEANSLQLTNHSNSMSSWSQPSAIKSTQPHVHGTESVMPVRQNELIKDPRYFEKQVQTQNQNQTPMVQGQVPMAGAVYQGQQFVYGPINPAVVAGNKLEMVQTESEGSGWYFVPLFGRSSHVGRWNDHIKNSYTFGLVLERPMSENFSLEIEGDYGRSYITYSNYIHSFNQFGIGGNGKYYLMQGVFRPFVGAGIMGIYYHNMTGGPLYPFNYSRWVGTGQLIAGGEITLSDKVSIGVRGAFIRPLFNQPGTLHNGVYSAPGFEETSAINTSFMRLMGSVKIAF